MSKRSLFWGNASGKLGEVVFYRSGGEQRSRSYVEKIKNPKTLAQMKNRLSMLNFATTYRMLKPILSVSFPNRPAKESGFNAFVKANKSIKSAVISRDIANAGLVVPYNMLLSQGYLTQFGEFKRFTLSDDSVIAGFDLTSHPNFSAIKEAWPNWDDIVDGFENQEAYERVWDLLQLPADAKITIVQAQYQDEGYSLRFVTVGKDTDYKIACASPFRMSPFTENTSDNPRYFLRFGDMSSEDLICAIISYKDASGKLQVTNSRMVVPSDDEEFATQFVEGGDVYQQVLDYYGYNPDASL